MAESSSDGRVNTSTQGLPTSAPNDPGTREADNTHNHNVSQKTAGPTVCDEPQNILSGLRDKDPNCVNG